MSFRREIKKVRKAVKVLFNRLFLNEILVIGDSHTRVFRQKSLGKCVPGSFFHVIGVNGATASGLTNPNSKTQAYQVFRKALATTRAKRVVVMLGEVDTGFVIWYRTQKYNQPVEEMLKATVDTYTGFLLELKERGLQVTCISTPLPTIQDGNEWGEIARARKEVTASLRERTELTLSFNLQVEAFCRQHELCFLNFDHESLGDNGTVASVLLNSDPNDHHYNPSAYAAMIVPRLQKVLVA